MANVNMEFVAKYSELQLNRNLIDSNFQGYKIDLDSLPIYQFSIANDLDLVRLTEDQYSYQHLKSFGSANHLFRDPLNPETTWFIDDHWCVQRAGFLSDSTGNQLSVTSCYSMTGATERRIKPNRVNSTLHFTSVDWAVLADGASWLYLLQTGDRSNSLNDWKVSYAGQPLGSDVHFTVLHSVLRSDEQMQYLDVVCLHVEENPDFEPNAHEPVFVTRLEWLSFTAVSCASFVLSRTRRLESFGSPDYVAVHPQGASLIVACQKPVKFVYDSIKPIADRKVKQQDLREFAYKWNQTSTEVTVQFLLAPPVIVKENIFFRLTSGHVELKAGQDNVLLVGDLGGLVDVSSSTWTLDNNILELSLCKVEPVDWTSPVPTDVRGERVFSDDQISRINQQLDRFTSESLADTLDDENKTFNTEELEECDRVLVQGSSIYHIDGERHEILEEVNIAFHQWIFSGISSSTPDELPVFCLRHDVDGIIWQPTVNKTSVPSTDITWRHVATFNALGYVHAGKQDRKYVTCAPDFSYAVIANSARHVFVYRQPAHITSPVRNRKTGEKIESVAKQHLLSLELADDIVGVQASERRIFVLAGKTLYAATVRV